MSGTVKFKFGGVQQTVRVELRLAPLFEDATGLGYITLWGSLVNRTATLTQVLAVLRVALKENGKHYDDKDMLALMGHEGLVEAYISAAAIVTELMKRPETSPGKGKPARSGQTAEAIDSH